MAYYPTYSIQIPIRNGSLLPGVCFRSEQERLNAFSSVQYAEFPGNFSVVIISPNQPTVEEQDTLWMQTDAFNNPIQQFLFSSQFARWVWPHWKAANDPRPELYDGILGDIPFLDGGDAGAISETTGSFWELDNNWTDRFPIGAGTVPEGTEASQFAGPPTYPATYPQARGIYFIRRTARKYLTS